MLYTTLHGYWVSVKIVKNKKKKPPIYNKSEDVLKKKKQT